MRAEGPVFVVPGTRKLLLNLTHVETPMEPAGLALAGIEGRRQVDALLRLFKRELPEAVEDNLTRETTDSWAGEAARAAKLTTLRGGRRSKIAVPCPALASISQCSPSSSASTDARRSESSFTRSSDALRPRRIRPYPGVGRQLGRPLATPRALGQNGAPAGNRRRRKSMSGGNR